MCELVCIIALGVFFYWLLGGTVFAIVVGAIFIFLSYVVTAAMIDRRRMEKKYGKDYKGL